jgi:UDP-2-acetamido-3-amino-2,3-dideoxy-glucuronate N-acetyltransferase
VNAVHCDKPSYSVRPGVSHLYAMATPAGATATRSPTNHGFLAVIGAGGWGINHVRTASELNYLGAVADVSAGARAAARALAPHTPVFPLAAAALAHSGIRAVIVATPPAEHFAVACAALDAGLHVLIEKPLCETVSQAEELVARAHAAGRAAGTRVVLMVGHLLHYGRGHRKMLRLVRNGHIGAVTRVRATRLNFGTVRTAENVLWSLCPHDVSIVMAVCCESGVESVACAGQSVVDGNLGVEDYVTLQISFQGGARAHIEASWMHPEKERRMVVYGTKGCVVVNEARVGDKDVPEVQLIEWATRRAKDGRSVAISKVEKPETHVATLADVEDDDGGEGSAMDSPLARELQHFAMCCNNPTLEVGTDGEEGVRVLQVLLAATKSMRECGGNAVKMPGSPAGQVTAGESSGAKVTKLKKRKERSEAQLLHYFVHETAIVEAGASLGDGTKVWHFAHVMSGARVGESCKLGQNVYVGGGAVLGKNVKVQNNVSVYDGVICEDDVFLGPSCVFTNVKSPRSAFPVARGEKGGGYVTTRVCKGATIGANATILCGVNVGAYAMVGAGAVVTKNVAAHMVVVGNPAKCIGYMGVSGARLVKSENGSQWVCPASGQEFMFVTE